MDKGESFVNKIFNLLYHLSFKFKKFYQQNKNRDKYSYTLLIDKYIANYNKIAVPFKKALPLIKYGSNPILMEGNPGDWDEMGIAEPFILFNNKKFFLYYESCTKSENIDWQIGVATADKIIGPWIKHQNNPILRYTKREGDYDKQCVADPCVIYHNGKYHMWFDMFDGKVWRIGNSNSKDGLNWEKFTLNDKTAIVLDIGKKNQWDCKWVHCPEVYLWNNKFHMLYGGIGIGDLDFSTGLAIENRENGNSFKKWSQVTNNNMFGKSLITSRMQAGFILNGIIFAGLRVKINMHIETTYIIYSDDGGKSWNKLSGPILEPGSKKEWDSKLFYGPDCWIISEDKLWTAYLGGNQENLRRLGLAYMAIPKIE